MISFILNKMTDRHVFASVKKIFNLLNLLLHMENKCKKKTKNSNCMSVHWLSFKTKLSHIFSQKNIAIYINKYSIYILVYALNTTAGMMALNVFLH